MLTDIQSAGKMLSRSNLSTIKSAWQALTKLLVEAGEINDIELPPTLRVSAGADLAPYDVRTKGFAGLLKEHSWHRELGDMLDMFRNFYSQCCHKGNKEEARQYVEELNNLLMEHLSDAPQAIAAESEEEDEPVTIEELIAADSEEEDLEETPPVVREEDDEEDEERELPPVVDTDAPIAPDDGEEEEIAASEECFRFEIAASARIDRANNSRPVEGVLFRVDEPSEAIPNVGPGLPLFIPQHVALAAMEEINRSQIPKPLDAHDSFSQHASTEIVGAMTEASIRGKDFVVRGYLWDYNQPDKVERISAARDRLGMSVNAVADGHIVTLPSGVKCWQVDRLRIMGANILFSQAATFRQTKILSAESLAEGVLIAASGENSSLTGEEKQMDPDFIVKQLEAIGSGIQQTNANMQELLDKQSSLDLRLSAIEAEREQGRKEIAAAAQQEQKQQEQAALVQGITSAIQSAFAEQNKMLGVRSPVQPPRKTVPLAASAAAQSESSEENEYRLQLAAIDGELRGLQNSNYSADGGVRIAELLDIRRRLTTGINV